MPSSATTVFVATAADEGIRAPTFHERHRQLVEALGSSDANQILDNGRNPSATEKGENVPSPKAPSGATEFRPQKTLRPRRGLLFDGAFVRS